MIEDPQESEPDDIDDYDGDEDEKVEDELSVEKAIQQEFAMVVKEIEEKQLKTRKPPPLRASEFQQSKEPPQAC